LVNAKTTSLLRELSHELRDALSPVRAALDLMRLRGLSADATAAAAPRIEQGLERALATLDAFVLAEQYESGTLALAVVPVPLARLLQLALEKLPAPLRARCRLASPASDIEVPADFDRSVQALTAMLQRALAASPGDTPIEIRAVADAAGVRLHIAFPTPQPPAEPEWFESYRSPPGAGTMALRTARCIMRLQQGSLELRATEPDRAELVAGFSNAPARRAVPPADTAGATAAADRTAQGDAARRGAEKGATAGGAAASPGVAERPASGGIQVLMVEDNADVRRSYREALVAMGYEVREARTAEEALGAATAAPPEIALIDINLPGMNGYRLAQTLKAQLRGAIRLVMLSGVTLDDITLQLSRQAGFDQCFDKAAGPKALHALLLRLEGGGHCESLR
jgi:CheY-like chemotaxis protein